ncbi:MAG: energy transducer TonB [Verrucomicrobia bacterium]|nr:MAG: energy transducer TonB [Verrucomicrobiota bacterium]
METGITQEVEAAQSYTLHDDLARLSLPQEYKDSYRRLAWVDSICALFLIIGLIGVKSQPFHVRELPEITEVVPVVIQQPPEPPKPDEAKPDEPEKPQEVTDEPVVATVVAANPAQVAFAVPVKGPVIIAASPRFAQAPPAHTRDVPTGPTRYVPSNEDWGGNPAPRYPPNALRNGYQGKVVIEVTFDASGALTDAVVRQSSRYRELDEAALSHVKKNLRLSHPPGEARVHTIEVIFQIR